ncbi:MAG TPA: RloB family protein [Actinophytocola sp.]|uniref:RloB family protein n=1 Tax=Actinophytocola sp. TaxID=1872138 RepID=UPI002DFA2A7E|nr:RloB family protein [Actinophytocola sp.]
MSKKRRTDPNADRPLHPGPRPPREERVFYVAVEGASTEPDYLSYLNDEFGRDLRFRIHPLWRSKGLKPREVVEAVLAQRSQDEGDEKDEFWALFDRDEHVGIPQAIAKAKKNDVRIGFSHPSFDLWLLLHLAAFSGAQGGSSVIVHEKLRKHPAFETFEPNGDKSIRNERVEALKGKENVAAKRARKLTNDCPNPACNENDGHADHCDPLCRDPSTDMWELLVALKIIER